MGQSGIVPPNVVAMDLDNIRVFTKVVRLGSLTRAAENLGVPKSTVSRRLAELESQLGARLIQRTTRRLSLTDAGQRYYQQTELHINELEAAEKSIHDLQGGPRGTLRITAPTDMTHSALVGVIDTFLTKYPEVKLIVLATNRRVDLVAEGIDLALRAGPLPSSSLIARKVIAGQFWMFASHGYVERCGQPTTLNELANHECLLFSAEQSVQKWRLRRGDEVQEVEVNGRCAITDFSGLTSACEAGLGIALLPNIALKQPGIDERLLRVLPDWCGPDSILHAVYPSANQVSPSVRAFVEHVAEHFANESQRPV